MMSLFLWMNELCQQAKKVRMLIVPHALWTYGSLVAMLGAMSLWMASPVHAQSINASNDVSVACSDNAIANSPWGMVYCTDEDRAVANVAAAFASDRETNERPVPLAPLSCSATGDLDFADPYTITCTGGRGNEVNSGLSADDIYDKAGTPNGTNYASRFTFNLNDFEDELSASAHVIYIDLTSGNVQTNAAVAVNLQTNSATKKAVNVSGANISGLFVKSNAGVIINNAGPIVHARSGQSFNNQFRGMLLQSGGSRPITVTNSGDIGNTCTSSCGVGHFGMELLPTSSGSVNVTNSGRIRLGGNTGGDGDGSAAIFIARATTSVTINNTGQIRIGNTRNRSGRAIGITGASSGATINFQGGNVEAYYIVDVVDGDADDDITINVSGGRVSGAVHLQGGDDTLTVNEWRCDAIFEQRVCWIGVSRGR